MKADTLFQAVGGADKDLLERSEKRQKKAHWLIWAISAACLVIVAFVAATMLGGSDEETVGDLPPTITVNDMSYVVSSSYSAVSDCPDGFEYCGTITASDTQDAYLVGCKYYINDAIPEWIYVYCEVWDSNNDVSMAYVRFVENEIRNADFIRYNERIYVSMWSYWSRDNDYYDSMRERYGIRVETDIPENCVLAGKAHFEEKDRIPQTQLGVDHTDYNSAQVYANRDDNQVLYVGTSWYTATSEENGETLHTGYDVFILYENAKINE